MRIERRVKLKGPRLARKVPKPKQQPVGTPLFSYVQFIAGDVEGRSVPTVSRFYLYQSGPLVRGEAGYVVARPVAVLFRHPSYPLRKIAPTGDREGCALMLQYKLFTGASQSPVAFVSASDVKFPGDA